MRLRKPKSETAKLRAVVASLPKNVADWTPEQRREFTTQSDRATREENSVTKNVKRR
ncbi:hypothetical protein [Streptomyces sp. NPDC007110]|uniref:hypothetical protein n=1 Tax=Streptomyces sp. NPDC007110 TaxID=3156916 RepID=UPI0033F98946